MTFKPTADRGPLPEVEAWLRKNSIAGSALGKHLCEDASLLSRWRRAGCPGVTERKRLIVLEFIRKYPDGVRGLKRGGMRHRKQYTPNATDRTGHREYVGSSTPVPVPSLNTIDDERDIQWIKERAVKLGLPIVRVLADLVLCGIRCMKEDEYEESQKDTDINSAPRGAYRSRG